MQFANRSCSVLVATDVAARGLDIAQLEAVINVDVTQSRSSTFTVSVAPGRGEHQGLGAESGQRKEMLRSPVSRTSRAGNGMGRRRRPSPPASDENRWCRRWPRCRFRWSAREDSRWRRAGRTDRGRGIQWRPGRQDHDCRVFNLCRRSRAVAKAALRHLSSTKIKARRCACGLFY